jgi:hypothetical protein
MSANGAAIGSSVTTPASPLTSITDLNLYTWTLKGGVIYLQPPGGTSAKAGFSAGVTRLFYLNDVIYQEANGKVWSWTNSAWKGPIADPRVPSPNGTTIATYTLSPTTPTIVDSNSNIWTVASGIVYENGAPSGKAGGVVALSLKNGVMYEENSSHDFFSWNSASLTWVAAASPIATGVCGGDNGLYLGSAPIALQAPYLCSVGTASAVTGSGPWNWTCAVSAGAMTGPASTCTAKVATALPGETLTAVSSSPNNSTFVLGTPVTLTFSVAGMTPFISTLLNLNIVNEQGAEITSAHLIFTSEATGAASVSYTAPSSQLGYYQVNASLADGTTIPVLATRPAGFITYAVVTDPASRTDYGDELSRFGMQGGFSVAMGPVIPYLGIRYVLSSAGGWASLESKGPGTFLTNYNAAKAKNETYPPKSTVSDEATYNGKPWNTYSIGLISKASVPSWAGPVPGTGGTSSKTFGELFPPDFGGLASPAGGMAGLTSFATAYATEVAADYPKQTHHYYQVTWEPAFNPTPWGFGGTPAELVQYFQATRAAIHKSDPSAVVVGPTLFPTSANELSTLFENGFGNVADGISMHPYVYFPPENPPSGETSLVLAIRAQQALAKQYIPAVNYASTLPGKYPPFIGTEHGLVSATPEVLANKKTAPAGAVSPLEQAEGNIRQTLILLGEGFALDFSFYIADFWGSKSTSADPSNYYGFYYNLDQKISAGTDLVDPKPAVPAFSAMTYLIDGTTTNGPVSTLPATQMGYSDLTGTQMGYSFSRGSGSSTVTVLALWDYGSTPSTAKVNVTKGSYKTCTWMGNCTSGTSTGSVNVTLSGTPVYLISGD